MNGPRRAVASLCMVFAASIAGVGVSPLCKQAYAQGPEKLDVKSLFKEARELYDEGNFADALPVFQQVFDASQSPNALLYLARCYDETGQPLEAYMTMNRVVELADMKAAEDPKYEGTRNAAKVERDQFKTKVGLVLIAVSGDPDGLSIRLNGNPIDDSDLESPVVVEPGPVAVEATAPDYKTVTKNTNVPAGATRTVAIKLVKPVPDAPVDRKPEEKGAGLSDLQVAGLVVGGAGLVGFGVFAVTGSISNSKFNEVETACSGTTCTDPAFADTIDEGKSLETVANISLVAGGALLATGIGLVVFGGDDNSGPDAKADGATPRLIGFAGPDGAYAGARWAF